MEILSDAIQNEKNQNILSLTFEKINERKHTILSELKLLSLKKKLKDYRHVDELQEFRIGSYIRWINLSKKIFTSGGIMVKIDIENSGIIITCKNRINQFFTLKLDECIVFQKLTQQEYILLTAIQQLT
jgi:hypothetical protein